MGLLTDIYNTVAKFFRQQDEQYGDASKSVATNRLKLVLMQDRTNLTPKILEQMRGEMVDLLSKYLEMDKDLLELNFEQEGDQVALMLSIPVIRAKDEDEIEEAIRASKVEQNEAVEEDNDTVTEADETADETDDEAEIEEESLAEDTESIENTEEENTEEFDEKDLSDDEEVTPSQKKKRTKKNSSDESLKEDIQEETEVAVEVSEN